MKVQFIPQFKLNNINYTKQPQKNINKTPQYSYNPIAYKDYDITFGKRLFRDPEDFYAQDFNEKGMPKLLDEYIYEGVDTNFKKTVPPAQAMQEVYGSLKYAQNLDMVKQIYPNEPLFSNLHSKSSINAREGILGELALMKNDESYAGKSLFKNGKDDLGLYILKKIYIEGKTLKEINKDFHRDTSVVYEGLGDIKYSDLKAFGIHFPNRSFWKSFIATRKDFPYVYIPRKAEIIKEATKETQRRNTINTYTPKPHRKKFDGVKDWELDKITRVIEDTNGGISDIQRKIRKNGNSESNNFVSQYMGEIMSVTLDRLHASPEMKAFFEDYENLSVSQRSILKKYWTTPNARQNLSIVMKSTIQMFMDAYDEDGENDEFHDLLEYAHSIKPLREEAEQKHIKMQQYYEDIFKDYGTEIPEKEKFVTEKVEEPEILTIEKVRKLAAEKGANVQEIMLPDGKKVIMTYNRKELCEDMIEDNYGIFPTEFKQRMINHLYKSTDATDKYLLAISLETNGLDRFIPLGNCDDLDDEFVSFVREQLFPADEINNVARKIGNEFNIKNKKLIANSRQVLMELAFKMPFGSNEYMEKYLNEVKITLNKYNLSPEEKMESVKKLYRNALTAVQMLQSCVIGRMTISEISSAYKDLGIKNLNKLYLNFIDERMKYYSNPLSNKELKTLNSTIPTAILNYNSKDSKFLNDKEIGIIWDMAVQNARKNPVLRKEFLKAVREMFIFADNTFMRSFLDNTVDNRVKEANMEQLATVMYQSEVELIKLLAAYDLELVENELRYFDAKLYDSIKGYNKYSQLYFSQLSK